ncbi:MAG: M14 family zinc carboxypeptidase [Patescibacteria group bacterium]
MINKFKKKLGYIKRGLHGMAQNNLERAPKIPADVKTFAVGESVNKEPIKCFQIGDGPTKVLYVSGIHGNEVGTIKLAHHLMKWMHGNCDKLKDFSLFVIPCLNPDGFKMACKDPDYMGGGKIGRFNANEVDLNRNLDTPSFKSKSAWHFGRNYSESVEVFCGSHGNSEPEIKALTAFIDEHGIKMIFMFHNAGREVMGNENALSQKLTKIYCEKTGFAYVSNEDWAQLKQTGTMKEWCDMHDISYIEVEGSTRWGSDWKRQKSAIEATLKF